MRITRLQLVNKKRYLVYIDDAIAFVLYKGDMRSYGIVEGDELEESVYKSIMQELLPKRALSRAMYLLEKRDYTVRQITDKLKEGFYPRCAIDYAITRLLDYGFLDDERYATRYIECYIDKKSRQKIAQTLYMKGIGRDIVDRAFDIAGEEGYVQDSSELIQNLLRKRHYYDSEEHTAKDKAKQFSFLLSKGFSASDIRRELA